jgi:hypothetical protein
VLTQEAGRPVDGPVLTDWAARVVDVVRWVAVAVVPAAHRFQPDDRRFTGGRAFLLMLLAMTIGQLVLHNLAQHTW